MSVVPILVGLYIASLFIHFPFTLNQQNLATVSWVMLFSLTLSLLGYKVTKQLITPLAEVSKSARKIAQGELDRPIPEIKGTEELEELTHSLHTISKNAKELLDRVEKLSMHDKLTGLFNSTYIRERFKEEIQRAIHFQRPCAFAYFVIDSYDELLFKYGSPATEEILRSLARIFSSHLSEFDRAARIQRGEFAIIFSDKNKRRAIEIVQSIQREVAAIEFDIGADEPLRLTLSSGLTENPLDGIDADALFTKAQQRMRSARFRGKNLVEAFE